MQPQRIQQSQIFFQEDDEQFASFSQSSDGLPVDQTQFSMHNQQQIILKTPSQNFQKLYKIYVQNNEMKKNLQKQITRLKQLQRNQKLCARDAQEQNPIQQYIDIDQNSTIYIKSEEQYRKRKRQIYDLQSQYRQLKIMSVQALMKLQQRTDTKLNDAITKFLKNNKEIFGWTMCKDGIAAICRENRKRKRNMKYKIQKDKLSKQPSQNSQNINSSTSSKQNIYKAIIKKEHSNDDDLSRSRSNSENSEHNKQHKLLSRYSIRFIKYCEISLQTHPNYSEKIDTLFIPAGTFQPNQPAGIVINDKLIKDQQNALLQYEFIVYSDKKVLIFKVDPKVIGEEPMKTAQESKQKVENKNKILKIKKYSQLLIKRQTIQFDSKVCLVQIQTDINKHIKLFVGTEDGVMRKFTHSGLSSEEGKLYNIQNLYFCYPKSIQNFQDKTIQFCVISPNTIIFVNKGKNLYELNMDDYEITLLSQLPEKVELLTPKLILTQTMCYSNYYQIKGKVAMIHNSQLNKIVGKDLCIGIIPLQNDSYMIGISQGNGNVSIEICDKL